jgi:L,D-peptidoglycan transpeptidase YkuD (ErfK/YbiS/YcfS/YnhG family)
MFSHRFKVYYLIVIVPYFMIKSFLNLIYISTLLFSSEQIVLVVSDDFNASTANMECYEDGKKVFNTIKVNLGKNGLGWGLGEVNLVQKIGEPLKYEGDKKAPIGVFKLTSIFGYEKNKKLHMPYHFASENLICVDDSESKDYNKIIFAHGDEKSFEYIKRKDDLYKYGIVVGHNQNAVKKRGSCIFIHIQRGKNVPTVGCTSMKEEDIKKIVYWLERSKNPILIQIPKSAAKEIKKLYPALENSTLLL